MTNRDCFDNIELMDAEQGSFSMYVGRTLCEIQKSAKQRKKARYFSDLPYLICQTVNYSTKKIKNIYLEEECQR